MGPRVVRRGETETDRPVRRAAPGRLRRAAPGRLRRVSTWMVTVTSAGLALSACGLHITKHGVSGDVLGHHFSAATGTLPAGFPSSIPVPDNSRVLGGGGTNGGWDVAFAATGDVASGATGYANQFRSAGFTVTNLETGSTPVAAPSSPTGGSTSTTVTVDGSTFTAKDAQWTVGVVAGSSTAPTFGSLKAGEFAINITAVPTSDTTTTG